MQNIEKIVLPFLELQETAFSYCKEENHITDQTLEKRKKQFEKQATAIWENIKEEQLELTVLSMDQVEKVLPQQWMEEHNLNVEKACVYYIAIKKELPREEKLSFQMMQNIWCGALLLAAKDYLEQKLHNENENLIWHSYAPGMEELPLEMMKQWAALFAEQDCEITIGETGYIQPENSLFAILVATR